MSNKRVFVLGAGSSIGHSQQCSPAAGFSGKPHVFPSINEFFVKATELDLRSSDRFELITRYAKRWFGWDVWRKKKVDIEELFTHIEIELERGRTAELLEVRGEILRLIKEVLSLLAEPILGQGGEYGPLQRAEILSDTDTVVTFNWDLLLDHLLGRETLLNRWYDDHSLGEYSIKPYFNFLLQLSAIGEKTMARGSIENPYATWDGSVGYYLKMHGSIDWAYCSNERCRGTEKVFPLRKLDELHKCGECHEPLEALVIPPVLNKAYRQYPLIRRIWNIASQELRVANELIIWGYSMPPTDFHTSWLMRQAREAPLHKLAIVNPEVDKPSASLARRVREIFHGKLSEEQVFLYRSFGDYSKDKPVGTLDRWRSRGVKQEAPETR